MTYSYQQAVVIGGSFAGLWTARVLADHFEQVTILERDVLPDGPQSRSGVPQDQHVHVLLRRGASIMGRLFPNIEEELLAVGAKKVDLTQDSAVYLRKRWLQQYESGYYTYACSRIMLESILRRRVQALPNVDIRGGAQVKGLLAEEGRVAGVKAVFKDGGGETAVSADFVADASGRRSKAPDWLAELGYQQPKETVIDSRLGYAGRRFKKPTNETFDWEMMLVVAAPGYQKEGGLIYTEEDGIWMVMLAGVLGEYPPTDEAEFMDYAKKVHPKFYESISNAEPTGKIIGYRQTENRMRHYEAFTKWPDRFVIVGDAACAFNPVYGQGISVGAMAAEALGERLAKSNGTLDGVAWQFQKSYPKIVGPAWLLATSADLDWLGGDENADLPARFASWYFPKMFDALPEDRVIAHTFTEVQNLTKPPTALFAPKVAWRVYKYWRSR